MLDSLDAADSMELALQVHRTGGKESSGPVHHLSGELNIATV